MEDQTEEERVIGKATVGSLAASQPDRVLPKRLEEPDWTQGFWRKASSQKDGIRIKPEDRDSRTESNPSGSMRQASLRSACRSDVFLKNEVFRLERN